MVFSGKFCVLFGLICLVCFGASRSCSGANKMTVQKKGKRLVSNGCSKPAGIKVMGEEDFTYCCDRHDACYSVCGMSKQDCDIDFGKCMKKLCKTKYSHNQQCSAAANMYEMGTTIFGSAGFDSTQEDFCACVDVSEAVSHYTGLVADFYREYTNKYDESDVTQLIQKYSSQSSSRLPKLYYELHKKYDKAISRSYIHERDL